ncbi:Uncharacterised protein [uncultured archaeon]|nr:Uncharacterised protein [uncultured archaeon]
MKGLEFMNKKIRLHLGILVSVSFIFFVLLSFASAADSTNLSVEDQASSCLNNSKVLMNQLVAENLTVSRVNDTISQAEVLYNAQEVLKARKQKTDFSLVISYCDSVSKIYSLALDSKDSLSTLLKYYKESVTPEMNTTTIDVIINETMFEMQSERYEKVQPLIDNAYQEITNVRARSTTLNLFVDSTTRGLKSFFLKNWKIIVAVLAVLTLLWFMFKTPIRVKLLNNQLDRLARRRESIKRLIMVSQKDYFQTGKIADSDYKIRVGNYAELVRDIDRQVPLIKEELAKLKGGKE